MSVNNQVSYGIWGDPPKFEIGMLNVHGANKGSSGSARLTFLPSNDVTQAQFEVGGETILLRADQATFRNIMTASEIQVDFDGAGYHLNAHVSLEVFVQYVKCLKKIAN
jgi:hypothetical protein